MLSKQDSDSGNSSNSRSEEIHQSLHEIASLLVLVHDYYLEEARGREISIALYRLLYDVRLTDRVSFLDSERLRWKVMNSEGSSSGSGSGSDKMGYEIFYDWLRQLAQFIFPYHENDDGSGNGGSRHALHCLLVDYILPRTTDLENHHHSHTTTTTTHGSHQEETIEGGDGSRVALGSVVAAVQAKNNKNCNYSNGTIATTAWGSFSSNSTGGSSSNSSSPGRKDIHLLGMIKRGFVRLTDHAMKIFAEYSNFFLSWFYHILLEDDEPKWVDSNNQTIWQLITITHAKGCFITRNRLLKSLQSSGIIEKILSESELESLIMIAADENDCFDLLSFLYSLELIADRIELDDFFCVDLEIAHENRLLILLDVVLEKFICQSYYQRWNRMKTCCNHHSSGSGSGSNDDVPVSGVLDDRVLLWWAVESGLTVYTNANIGLLNRELKYLLKQQQHLQYHQPRRGSNSLEGRELASIFITLLSHLRGGGSGSGGDKKKQKSSILLSSVSTPLAFADPSRDYSIFILAVMLPLLFFPPRPSPPFPLLLSVIQQQQVSSSSSSSTNHHSGGSGSSSTTTTAVVSSSMLGKILQCCYSEDSCQRWLSSNQMIAAILDSLALPSTTSSSTTTTTTTTAITGSVRGSGRYLSPIVIITHYQSFLEKCVGCSSNGFLALCEYFFGPSSSFQDSQYLITRGTFLFMFYHLSHVLCRQVDWLTDEKEVDNRVFTFFVDLLAKQLPTGWVSLYKAKQKINEAMEMSQEILNRSAQKLFGSNKVLNEKQEDEDDDEEMSKANSQGVGIQCSLSYSPSSSPPLPHNNKEEEEESTTDLLVQDSVTGSAGATRMINHSSSSPFAVHPAEKEVIVAVPHEEEEEKVELSLEEITLLLMHFPQSSWLLTPWMVSTICSEDMGLTDRLRAFGLFYDVSVLELSSFFAFFYASQPSSSSSPLLKILSWSAVLKLLALNEDLLKWEFSRCHVHYPPIRTPSPPMLTQITHPLPLLSRDQAIAWAQEVLTENNRLTAKELEDNFNISSSISEGYSGWLTFSTFIIFVLRCFLHGSKALLVSSVSSNNDVVVVEIMRKEEEIEILQKLRGMLQILSKKLTAVQQKLKMRLLPVLFDKKRNNRQQSKTNKQQQQQEKEKERLVEQEQQDDEDEEVKVLESSIKHNLLSQMIFIFHHYLSSTTTATTTTMTLATTAVNSGTSTFLPLRLEEDKWDVSRFIQIIFTLGLAEKWQLSIDSLWFLYEKYQQSRDNSNNNNNNNNSMLLMQSTTEEEEELEMEIEDLEQLFGEICGDVSEVSIYYDHILPILVGYTEKYLLDDTATRLSTISSSSFRAAAASNNNNTILLEDILRYGGQSVLNGLTEGRRLLYALYHRLGKTTSSHDEEHEEEVTLPTLANLLSCGEIVLTMTEVTTLLYHAMHPRHHRFKLSTDELSLSSQRSSTTKKTIISCSLPEGEEGLLRCAFYLWEKCQIAKVWLSQQSRSTAIRDDGLVTILSRLISNTSYARCYYTECLQSMNTERLHRLSVTNNEWKGRTMTMTRGEGSSRRSRRGVDFLTPFLALVQCYAMDQHLLTQEDRDRWVIAGSLSPQMLSSQQQKNQTNSYRTATTTTSTTVGTVLDNSRGQNTPPLSQQQPQPQQHQNPTPERLEDINQLPPHQLLRQHYHHLNTTTTGSPRNSMNSRRLSSPKVFRFDDDSISSSFTQSQLFRDAKEQLWPIFATYCSCGDSIDPGKLSAPNLFTLLSKLNVFTHRILFTEVALLFHHISTRSLRIRPLAYLSSPTNTTTAGSLKRGNNGNGNGSGGLVSMITDSSSLTFEEFLIFLYLLSILRYESHGLDGIPWPKSSQLLPPTPASTTADSPVSSIVGYENSYPYGGSNGSSGSVMSNGSNTTTTRLSGKNRLMDRADPGPWFQYWQEQMSSSTSFQRLITECIMPIMKKQRLIAFPEDARLRDRYTCLFSVDVLLAIQSNEHILQAFFTREFPSSSTRQQQQQQQQQQKQQQQQQRQQPHHQQPHHQQQYHHHQQQQQPQQSVLASMGRIMYLTKLVPDIVNESRVEDVMKDVLPEQFPLDVVTSSSMTTTTTTTSTTSTCLLFPQWEWVLCLLCFEAVEVLLHQQQEQQQQQSRRQGIGRSPSLSSMNEKMPALVAEVINSAVRAFQNHLHRHRS